MKWYFRRGRYGDTSWRVLQAEIFCCASGSSAARSASKWPASLGDDDGEEPRQVEFGGGSLHESS
jgi:hypothetical protein